MLKFHAPKYKTVILILGVLILNSCSSSVKKVYCHDSRDPIFIYKNPEEAFPSTVKNFKLELQAANSELSQLLSPEFNLSTTVEKKVINLREKLNQYNILIENQIKAAFIGYNLKPCDKELSNRYFEYLDKLSKETIALEKLKLSIDETVNKSSFEPINSESIEGILTEYEENSTLYNIN